MATEIRRTYGGKHPVKRNHPRSYYKPGELSEHHAQVLAVVGADRVAISMNGTAVLTDLELSDFFVDIANAMAAERK